MNENRDDSDYWMPCYNFPSKITENKVAEKPIRKDVVYQCAFCKRPFFIAKPDFCPTCGYVEAKS